MQDASDDQDHDHDPGDDDGGGGDDILPDMEEQDGVVDPMDVSERAEAQVRHIYRGICYAEKNSRVTKKRLMGKTHKGK